MSRGESKAMLRAIHPSPRNRRRRRAIADGDKGTSRASEFGGAAVVGLDEIEQGGVEAVDHRAFVPKSGTARSKKAQNRRPS